MPLENQINNCDPERRFDREIVVVKRSEGWLVNHKPEVPEPGQSMITEFEYDELGRVTGAVTTLTIPGPLYDPDGDLVEVKGWTKFRVFVPKTNEIVPAESVEIDGLTVHFRHWIEMGRPQWFLAEYAAADPWEETTLRFCVPGHFLGC